MYLLIGEANSESWTYDGAARSAMGTFTHAPPFGLFKTDEYRYDANGNITRIVYTAFGDAGSAAQTLDTTITATQRVCK
jgi:hypothetical protein